MLQAKLGVTGSLVARLCKPYADQNYCVFTDRFYSSVTLAEYMLNEQGTRMCGTAVPPRKLFPKSLVHKKMEKGSSTMLYNGDVATLVWCDKRPIYFVTTKYISDVRTTIQRYDAKEHKKVPVVCPAVVKTYNENMGGTDKNDVKAATMPSTLPLATKTFYEVRSVGSLQCIRDAALFLSTQSAGKTTQNISHVCR